MKTDIVMKTVQLPLVPGNKVTLFIGAGHLAVVDSNKEPGTCRVIDGLHNNGGWHVKLTVEKTTALIKKALEA